MPPPKVSLDITNFVARLLTSVEHLEVFILLQRTQTRSWSPADIAAELQISVATAADVLEHLASDNFLDIKISNDILYRFNAATAALEEASSRVADLYLRERITMTKLATSTTLRPLRDFAEAFRIKKDGRDG